jgi:DNA-binding FrmR family transcriptional regulator
MTNCNSLRNRCWKAAAQIEALKKEADCSDIVQALEDAGIPMGDGEQCQDIITAIEILGSRIESLKEKLVEERSDRILRRQHDYEHNYSFTKSDALDLASQQLKADPDLQKAGVEWE